MPAVDKEIKREENRRKMDQFDDIEKVKLDEEKKEGVD